MWAEPFWYLPTFVCIYRGKIMRELLEHIMENGTLKKLTLSRSTDKSIIRTVGRLIEIKGKTYVALESFYTDGKAVQVNYETEKAADVLADMVPEQYKEMYIFTTRGNCEIKASRKGKVTVFNHISDGKAAVPVVPAGHNRQKKYIIPADSPVDFLIELGVQDASGRIFDKKRAKFRQINRFLEIVSDVESSFADKDNLYVLDLCCGKSYLSFALYYYFTVIKKFSVYMDCVDLKKDVIEYCSVTAEKLGYEGLRFTAGDIRNFEVKRAPDLTVSLHACDIATDIVLAKGIDSGSGVILSTPCCHHEMMHQLKPQGGWTDFLLEHSILKQKFADAATDALRCRILQIKGYEVNAMELIDPDETPKNVMIRAVKRKNASDAENTGLIREYGEICDMLGISPYLWEYYYKK